jgi:CubicO group peptidase (beta-lactamase class C family)
MPKLTIVHLANHARSAILLAVTAGGAAALLAATPAAQVASRSTTPDFSAIRAFINTEMGIGARTPSLAVAVARGPDVLWEEGFGSIDGPGGTAATVNTLYYAASVTKTITATALMILHERKQLDLDRPANLYLKAAKIRSPHWNADDVTVRHLATHTSGLATFNAQEQIPAAETIRRYGIVFRRPGDQFDYSNLGFGVLGQLIADVSGRSFQAFVHDEVLRPLAMEHAWAGASPTSRHPVAPRYISYFKKFSPPMSEPRLPGASVLYSSAHELALFGMFHLKARHPAQKAVMSDAAIDALQGPAVTSGNLRHSLAWSINDNQYGYRTLLAQGGTWDSQAWLLLVPSENIAVVVLANGGDVPAREAIDRILSLLLPTYRENRAKAATPVSSATTPAATHVSAAPPELVGIWSGEIQTHKKTVPLVVKVTSAGEVEARLDKTAAVTMTNVRLSVDRLTGRVAGNLGITYDEHVDPAPHELRFQLSRQGNQLIGAAITYDYPQLPFWVELRRGEDH